MSEARATRRTEIKRAIAASESRMGKLDPEYVTTDRLLDIWSRDGKYGEMGAGLHPLEVMRLLNDGEVLGGRMSDDDVMIAVDQAYCRAPKRIKALLHVWYKTYAPAEMKAKRLGISRSAFYVEWRMSLAHMRGVLREKGLHV